MFMIFNNEAIMEPNNIMLEGKKILVYTNNPKLTREIHYKTEEEAKDGFNQIIQGLHTLGVPTMIIDGRKA